MAEGPSPRTRSNFQLNPNYNSLELNTLTSRQLALNTSSEEQAISLAIKLGLLSKLAGKCPKCLSIMNLITDATRKLGMRFRCSCNTTVSLSTNSYFENSTLEIWKILALTYHFCNLDLVTKAAVQCEVTEETACHWFKKMRKVQAIIVSNLGENRIGGIDHVVEIDEFHLYTPKDHKGREPAKKALWGFGGIDINTRDAFVVPVFERNKEVLLPLIRKFIHPGTTIYSDMWRTYKNLKDNLADMDIRHGSVNHKTEFVNSDDPQVHTQTIERLWLSFRALVPKTTNKIMVNSYFALFLYFVKYEWSTRHPGDRFRLFCHHIGEVYPGPFRNGKKLRTE
jgi:hypothetical protein